MKRSGMTLLEMLAVISLIVTLGAVFSDPFRQMVKEMSWLNRQHNQLAQVQTMMRQLENDLQTTMVFEQFETEEGQSVVELRIATEAGEIVWEKITDQVIRYGPGYDASDSADPNSDAPDRMVWELPLARFDWSVRSEQGKAWAVELQTAIQQQTSERTVDRMKINKLIILSAKE